jgi:transposase-like protein
MVTMRQYTPEFRQSAVNLVLVEGLSARKEAENLGIPIHTTHSWVASARRGTSGLTTPTASDPTARLRQLEAENRMLRIERDCYCVLVVSTSGYYRWKNATPSARSLRRSSLTTEVCGEHERSRGVYGSPSIHAQLCKRQIHVNVKTVAHIINDANIRAKTVKKWHPRTTQSNHTIAPAANVIERNIEFVDGCESCEPKQLLLECSNESFDTADALWTPDE